MRLKEVTPGQRLEEVVIVRPQAMSVSLSLSSPALISEHLVAKNLDCSESPTAEVVLTLATRVLMAVNSA